MSNVTTNINPQKCTTKVYLTLSIDETLRGSIFNFEITKTHNKQGELVKLSSPIKLNIYKHLPQIRYELFATNKQVNHQPYEEIIRLSEWFQTDGYHTCKDEWMDPFVTCGYNFFNNSNKMPIWDSQGFCCFCSGKEKMDKYFTNKNIYTRGGIDCSLTGKNSASAHCLRFVDLWYDVFKISTYNIYTNITIAISTDNEKKSIPNTINVNVGSFRTIFRSKKIFVLYSGEFEFQEQIPNLSSHILLVPKNFKHQMILVVPQHMISFYGTECNKIGTSYSAFRNQGLDGYSCYNRAGSCLMNQPNDLIKEDKKRLSSGYQPLYLCQRFGHCELISLDYSRWILKITKRHASISLLTITIDGSLSTVSYNISKGKILLATTNYTNLGRIHRIDVLNYGNIDAVFTISMSRCFSLIDNSKNEVSQMIKLKSITTFTIPLLPSIHPQNHSCPIILKDSLNRIIDRHTINFTDSSSCYCSSFCSCPCNFVVPIFCQNNTHYSDRVVYGNYTDVFVETTDEYSTGLCIFICVCVAIVCYIELIIKIVYYLHHITTNVTRKWYNTQQQL